MGKAEYRLKVAKEKQAKKTKKTKKQRTAERKIKKLEAIKAAIPLYNINGKSISDCNQSGMTTEAVLINAYPEKEWVNRTTWMLVDLRHVEDIKINKATLDENGHYIVYEKYTESSQSSLDVQSRNVDSPGDNYYKCGDWEKHELVLLLYLWFIVKDYKAVETWASDPDYQINHMKPHGKNKSDATQLEIVTAKENAIHFARVDYLRRIVLAISCHYKLKDILSAKEVDKAYKKVIPYLHEDDIDENMVIKVLLDMKVLSIT